LIVGSAAVLFAMAPGLAFAMADDDTVDKLKSYSLEDLTQVEVTSVSKRGEALHQAPAAIYVITHEDIARSGATSLPEILRLAPNLLVSQTGASRYVITARGHAGNPAAQAFANKLLVLIDGRSVYTPIFSGVYWDMQDVLPADIDRIEVISGPGATLWGANAVNGVINITTRAAADTQGGFLRLAAGTRQRAARFRYGGQVGETIAWRVYAGSFYEESLKDPAGARLHDHWSKPQAGFRVDWRASPADMVTLQGDAYDGYEAQVGARAETIRGGNLTARWDHDWAGGSNLRVQAYYDRAERGFEVNGVPLEVKTYDLDVQHSFPIGKRNDIVWGGGVRSSRYVIDNSPTLQFAPPRRTLRLANIFAQDTITLTPTAKLVVGVKVEDDPYVGPEVLPNLRLSWAANEATMVWAAVSRAVRSPTPLDRDVVEIVGVPFLLGGPRFRTEKLIAYELGLRSQLSPRARFSVSGFYNEYDDLRSVELTPVTFLPLVFDNKLRGHTYGVEAWGDYDLAPWWRLSGGVTYLDQKYRFRAGSSRLAGPGQAGDDPKYQASLKSAMNLGARATLDAALRYVSPMPDPRVSDYVELNARLAWNLTERVQVSISGRNLLHDRHVEYPQGAAIPRSAFVDLQWRF
jgi:iron complex outermembrane receptor protein